jgi:signal transduction histidine kinase
MLPTFFQYAPIGGTVLLCLAAVAVLFVGSRNGHTLSAPTLLPVAYLALHAVIGVMLFVGHRYELDRQHVMALTTTLDLIGIVVLGLAIWDMDRVARSVRHEIAASKAEAAEYDRARRDYEQLMRHRIANPLTVVSGGIATLRAHGEHLDAATRKLLLDDITAALGRLELVETMPTAQSVEEFALDAVPHVRRRVLAVA